MYYYRHINGEVISKSKLVVEYGGGPVVYFNSPYVVEWWYSDRGTD